MDRSHLMFWLVLLLSVCLDSPGIAACVRVVLVLQLSVCLASVWGKELFESEKDAHFHTNSEKDHSLSSWCIERRPSLSLSSI